MAKIRVLLITALCSLGLGFIIFSNYYNEPLFVVTEKALVFAFMITTIPFSWYLLSFFCGLCFGKIADAIVDDTDENSPRSNGTCSSNDGNTYTSSSDSSGCGCD